MPVDIRPLQAGDHDAWILLWRGYLAFYRTELSAAVTEETWRRLLDPAGRIHGIGAFEDSGRLIGLVHYLFHPVTWSLTDRCYLEDLFVAPEARGSGAGGALIEAVYRAADAAGADQVYWLTEEDNTVARRLYERVGQLTPFIKYAR